MADNPFAKYLQQPVAPEPDVNPFAQYAQPPVEQQQASLNPVPPDRMGMMAGGAAPVQQSMPASWKDTAVDVAKSGGIGLAQGAIGLGTTFGNMEMLGRMGIDKAGQMMGYDPQTTKGQLLPHYGHAKKFVEGYTGEFYEPKTTAGKYARTVGEFAPMAINPTVGPATRVASMVGGGLASEAAGQATEGTAAEPYARFAGGLVGSMSPQTLLRTATPNPIPPDRARQLAVLEREGVTALTAGQRTGNVPLKWTEAVTQDIPFSGKRATAMQTQQAEQFTRAALSRAGIQADRATPEVINAGFDRLGQQFETLAQNATVQPTPGLIRRLQSSVRDYNDVVAPTMRAPMVNGIVDDLNTVLRSGQPISGEAYAATRSALDKRARSVRISDPPLSEALFSIRNTLDDAVERALPPNLTGQYRQARTEYRNLLTLEKAAGGAGEQAVGGLISPAQLRTAAKTTNKRDYSRGRDDFSEMARAGVSIMSPLPQSGTAPRAAAHGVLHGLGAGAGLASGGFEGALTNLALTIGAPALAARGVMSRPVQGYLGNQGLAGLYNALERPALRAQSTVAGPQMFRDEPTEIHLTPDGRPR